MKVSLSVVSRVQKVKRFFLLLFFVVASLIILPEPVVAQGIQGAAAGTAVAAAFETAGYHAQAKILAELGASIEYLGALFYLGVLVSVLISYALTGSYRATAWLFVGPAFFFFISGIGVGGGEGQTVEASGTEWRFGAFEDTEERAKDIVVNLPNASAKVSRVFHQFNEFVSEGFQIVISKVTNNDIDDQMIFMGRQRMLDGMFGAEIVDSGVYALAAYFLNECATEVGDARFLALANNNNRLKLSTSYNSTRQRYCDRFPRTDKTIVPGPWMDFVYSLPGDPGFKVPKSAHLSTGRAVAEKVSCQQMWEWVIKGTTIEAQRKYKQTVKASFDPYALVLKGGAVVQNALRDVYDKITSPSDRSSQQTDADTGDPCIKIPISLDIATGANASEELRELTTAIGSKMLRTVMNQTPSQAIFSRVSSNHSGHIAEEGAAQAYSVNDGGRRRTLIAKKQEEAGKSKKYIAHSLIHIFPYIQGYLLYILALIYPFFCLLVIIPGHSGSFFTWVALWVWAKSWDVGWAIMMVADNILWELLPKQVYYNTSDAAATASPVTLLEFAYGGDPSYSMATYWVLLASMVMGVPMVTAHAILGAKRAIANRLVGDSGVGKIASFIGGTVGDKVGSANSFQESRADAQRQAHQQLGNMMHQYGKAKNLATIQALGNKTAIRGVVNGAVEGAPANYDFTVGGLKIGAGTMARALGDALPDALGGSRISKYGDSVSEGGKKQKSSSEDKWKSGGELKLSADQHSAVFDAQVADLGEDFRKKFDSNAYSKTLFEKLGDPDSSESKKVEAALEMIGADEASLNPLTGSPELDAKIVEARKMQISQYFQSVMSQGRTDIEAAIAVPAMAAAMVKGKDPRSVLTAIAQHQEISNAQARSAGKINFEINAQIAKAYAAGAQYSLGSIKGGMNEAYHSADLMGGRGGMWFPYSTRQYEIQAALETVIRESNQDVNYLDAASDGATARWMMEIPAIFVERKKK